MKANNFFQTLDTTGREKMKVNEQIAQKYFRRYTNLQNDNDKIYNLKLMNNKEQSTLFTSKLHQYGIKQKANSQIQQQHNINKVHRIPYIVQQQELPDVCDNNISTFISKRHKRHTRQWIVSGRIIVGNDFISVVE
ncbi:Hypothetical_protein [Hexamita inflata]|uniref:Hypothetical_protein n=1 Tax=Hexamita inflata TaxID=28002 RepID=A0AA86NJX3_9EUKA|nr:Hypothetical protein HINF_LOCUS8246 [Hexamita inflata]